MAITVTLTIEDGSGKSDSNSYASLGDFRSFWAQKNVDYSDNTVKGRSDNDISAALIMATEYVDGMHFFGERRLTTQSLAFPRSGLSRPGSSSIWPAYLPNDEVPKAVIRAVCYMAGLIIQGKSIFDPHQRVSSQSVSGVGSVSYADGTGEWYYPMLRTLLAGLINPGLKIERAL